MLRNRRSLHFLILILFVSFLFGSLSVFAEKVEKYIPDSGASEAGMTLWQTIYSGGSVMIVLALLSVAALALIIYFFLTITPEKLLPMDSLEQTVKLVEKKDYEKAKTLCKDEDSLPSKVLLAGLARIGREKVVIKEAMQDEGRRGVDDLWQKLSYLSDVAVISPMVGLLGTVLGMIQAFNVIAFQTGAVKPILLASGISKAMVTTATGLIIAIPAMIFHAYFRGVVQNITARLENVSSELFHLITD